MKTGASLSREASKRCSPARRAASRKSTPRARRARSAASPSSSACASSARARGRKSPAPTSSAWSTAAIPRSRAEIVVLGGHLDHLGVGQAVNGDAIYNGALDNAAGTATLIEVAKATAAAPPKRWVLFVATTAEEKGLLGAAYYAENPTVPADKVVAMVDLDMPILTYDFADVVAYGAEHSSVAEFVAAAAGEMGVSVLARPDPAGDDLRPLGPLGIRQGGRARDHAQHRRAQRRRQGFRRLPRHAVPPAVGRHVAADPPGTRARASPSSTGG